MIPTEKLTVTLFPSIGACLGLLTIIPALSSCGEAPPQLPPDHLEAAATCYAAKLKQMTGTTITPEQANEAAHFLYLGAVDDGMASPTALEKAAARGGSLQDKFTGAEDAARYREPCAKHFPQTVSASFKDLPADDRSTRMMCFTLSTAVLQTYQSSSISPPPATVEMNARLDAGLLAELNAEGERNVAELSGFAMRSMAKATELGPVNDVIKACASRYGQP